MKEKIRIGICGYGNLGKAIEKEIVKYEDMELISIFTRRNVEELSKQTNTKVVPVTDAVNLRNNIDVMIMCGGSATDLREQVPEFVKYFNTVDSFDTHAKILEHYNIVDKIAKENNKVGIISVGWDPGLFSLNRLYNQSILKTSTTYTFWGKGVSQGHSDAIRRIDGVIDAVQYTIPKEDVLDEIKKGETPVLTTQEKHKRECFVVVKDGVDKEKITKKITMMPNYFLDYDTTVYYITKEELVKNHKKMPHGGSVICNGITGEENKQSIQYKLKLESNPEFTGSILIAYARAAFKLNKEGINGAKTIIDIPAIYLSDKKREELLKSIL